MRYSEIHYVSISLAGATLWILGHDNIPQSCITIALAFSHYPTIHQGCSDHFEGTILFFYGLCTARVQVKGLYLNTTIEGF